MLPHREVTLMKMERLNIQLPAQLKAKLDALRKEGTSASGFIRNLLEKEFKQRKELRS
jgi:metal-responsive CopG/Arc/MetJ family transcriptional regulator